jgi:hypothetical protein
MNPIVRQIVNRQHVGKSYRSVIYAVIGGLKGKRRTFLSLRREDRRKIMRDAIHQHAVNRQQYNDVVSGRIG